MVPSGFENFASQAMPFAIAALTTGLSSPGIVGVLERRDDKRRQRRAVLERRVDVGSPGAVGRLLLSQVCDTES